MNNPICNVKVIEETRKFSKNTKDKISCTCDKCPAHANDLFVRNTGTCERNLFLGECELDQDVE